MISKYLPPWIAIPIVFVCYTIYLVVLTRLLPGLAELSEKRHTYVQFPRSREDLQALIDLLILYKERHVFYVYILFCSAYFYKQCFAIPGSVFMNILAGALFGVWIGFPIVCALTALGATGCYLLSKFFGTQYLEWYFPEKVAFLQSKVKENSDSLFFFLLFLRVFPVTPNWFINMASPVVRVPIHLFFLTILFGLMPYNFICVQTGSILSRVTSIQDMLSLAVMGKLACLAALMLLPAIILKVKHAYENKHTE